MRHLMGLVLAGGLLIGMAGESKAQFSISIGNPYWYGIGGYRGSAATRELRLRLGLSGTARRLYNNFNSYSNSAYVAGPGTFSYSSGYAGYAPVASPTSGYRGYAPTAYGYGYSGYRGYPTLTSTSGYVPELRRVPAWLGPGSVRPLRAANLRRFR